jgi:hypothetical protein
MEDFGIFNGHLVYSTAIWYIFWLFGILFSRFGTLHQEATLKRSRSLFFLDFKQRPILNFARRVELDPQGRSCPPGVNCVR